MAGSVNKVILIGNLGADPEIRRTQDGRPVANLRLATSESWKDKTTGERKEKTEWHRVVIFNENLCRIAEQYLKKGSKVFIEGALQTRKWQDQSGQDRYSTEVVLQGFRGELTLLDRAGGAGAGRAVAAAISAPMTRAAISARPGRRAKSRRRPAPAPARAAAARAATWTTRFRSSASLRRSQQSEREPDSDDTAPDVSIRRRASRLDCFRCARNDEALSDRSLSSDDRPHPRHQIRPRAGRGGDVRHLARHRRLHAAGLSLRQSVGGRAGRAIRGPHRAVRCRRGTGVAADQRLSAGLGHRAYAAQ